MTKKWAAAQKATGVKSAKITLLAGSDNNSDPATKEVVQYIKAQLDKLMPGLSITIKTMPTQSAKQLQDSGDFDLTLSGWGADFNDPISFLQVLTNSSSYNKGKYNSAKYNALVQKASTTDANDPAKRWDDMVQASQLLTTDQAVTPLYQSVYSWLQKSDVKGLVHNTLVRSGATRTRTSSNLYRRNTKRRSPRRLSGNQRTSLNSMLRGVFFAAHRKMEFQFVGNLVAINDIAGVIFACGVKLTGANSMDGGVRMSKSSCNCLIAL